MVDNDGDGSLTQEEFISALSLPNVQRYLTLLDVRIQELVMRVFGHDIGRVLNCFDLGNVGCGRWDDGLYCFGQFVLMMSW